MLKTAIIGGTGLTSIPGLEVYRREMIKTPFGAPSGPLLYGRLGDVEIAFLARHGHLHTIPPHKINYCANLWALHSVGVTQVISIGGVEGICEQCKPGVLVCPDQLVDYTTSRITTYHDGGSDEDVVHIDFLEPYTASVRTQLLQGAAKAGVAVIDGGTYGVAEGPRRNTRAEVSRMEKDGCTITGMTAMPEAALARELDLAFANLSVVVSRADVAGTRDGSAETLEQGMSAARAVIAATVQA